MSTYLILGTTPDGARWALADGASADDVRAEIAAAMDEQRTAVVPVRVEGHGRAAELLVNGRTLQAALVWSASSEPTINIID